MSAADLRTLKVGDFEPRTDEIFVVKLPDLELPLKLKKVNRLGDSGRPDGAFSLWFVGEPGPFLRQSIYPLVHPELGQLEIFLVPLGPREGGNLYESIFT